MEHEWTTRSLLTRGWRERFDATGRQLRVHHGESTFGNRLLHQRRMRRHQRDSLIFNLLLLADEPLEITHEGRCFRLERSFPIFKIDGLALNNMPLIVHRLTGPGRDMRLLVCMPLFNEPLLLVDPSDGRAWPGARYADHIENVDVGHAAKLVIDAVPPLRGASDAPPTYMLYSSPYNYAHDLINVLSGVVLALHHQPRPILSHAPAFWGPPQRYVAGADGVMTSSWKEKIQNLCREGPIILSRPVSDRIEPAVARVVCPSARKASRRSAPLIGLSLRCGSRSCVNESAVLSALIARLGAAANARFLLLGWLWPDGVTAEYQRSLRVPMEDVSARLSDLESSLGASDRSRLEVIHGAELTETTRRLPELDYYVVPCGTIGHLLAWFSGADGVVYGPHEAISRSRVWERSGPPHRRPSCLPERFLQMHDPAQHRTDYRIDPAGVDWLVARALKAATADRGDSRVVNQGAARGWVDTAQAYLTSAARKLQK